MRCLRHAEHRQLTERQRALVSPLCVKRSFVGVVAVASTSRWRLGGGRVVVCGRVREWLGRRAGGRGESQPAGDRVVPRVPSRARCREACGLFGVVAQAGVEGVADAPLERPDGLFAGAAVGDLVVVVGAAVGVPVADRVTAAMWMA